MTGPRRQRRHPLQPHHRRRKNGRGLPAVPEPAGPSLSPREDETLPPAERERVVVPRGHAGDVAGDQGLDDLGGMPVEQVTVA
jgi:hypothetical protein